uniref:InfA n=2 Tax=Ziziphus jujuba TaxID=326968 RepID=A0A192AD27_ZIZJJ|nr:InfA [Ziziphus jujuba]ANJ78377.1 InfA [Ziziphus jujuba var. spinosa]QTW90931.1 InfA [Ziziphus jujuba var. spinosa]UEE87802.1 translational initiation factor 1 [Ziziphus jujuba]
MKEKKGFMKVELLYDCPMV